MNATLTGERELRRYYEQEYLRNHPDMDVGDVPAKFEALRPMFDEVARAHPGGVRHVVEIGCGSGALLTLASRYLEASGVGLDLSEAVLQKARQTSPGQAFVQANAQQLPLALERCDVVMFADLLEHVPQPRTFLGSLRAARDVVMLVPLESGWFSDLVFRYRRSRGKSTNYETCGHLHRWNTRTALRLIRAAGLQIVSHEVRCGKFTQYTTWRGRLYGGISRALYGAWPWLHQRLFGAYTLLALCRASVLDEDSGDAVPPRGRTELMRILFIVKKLPLQADGVGDYTARLATALRARGHLVTVPPAVERVSELLDASREYQAEVIALQFSPFMYGRRGVCLYLIGWLLAARRFSRARVMVTFHELYNEWGRGPLAWAVALLHRLQFFALGALADASIFTTTRRHALGRRWFFWKKERIHCVPVGSNIEPTTASAPDLEAAQRRYRGDTRHLVCTFGMFQRGIQFEELLVGFAGLVHEDRIDAKLLFIGDWSNGELARHQKLQSLVACLSLTDRVLWSGAQPDTAVSTLLSISDIYVCHRADGPTTRSGTLAAALAHGLPVLANRCAELDPSFANGATVMLFDNAADLRRKCQQLLTDAPLQAQFAQRAREFSASRLAWTQIAERYEETWRDVHPKSAVPSAGPPWRKTRMTEIRNHA